LRRTGWGCAAGGGILPACPARGSTLDAGRYYNDQPADYLFWQGIALRKSGNPAQAEQHFRHFIDWAGSIGMTFRKPIFCRLSSGSGGSRCISAAETSAALLVY
jgi:hypothetical protein